MTWAAQIGENRGFIGALASGSITKSIAQSNVNTE
jgi:hypothetical protein